jgi:aminocarboxymuconate-semialdehyde decarboxylase
MNVDRRKLLTGMAATAGLAAGAPMAFGQQNAGSPFAGKVIDVHTHMFTDGWVDAVRQANDADVSIVQGERFEEVDLRGARIVRLSPEMTDFDLRIRNMDEAGVDLAIISLTTPNVFVGDRGLSRELARQVNDDFAAEQARHPDRIRWLTSLPWQNVDDAVEELERTIATGAAGVGLITNIDGAPLTEDRFKPIWREVERSGLPVFIHPTTPKVDWEGLGDYGLANTIGFTGDTSLCFARMILDGFLDEFPDLELIACHGGGTLPYLAARFDQMWARTSGIRRIDSPPSSYLRRLWFDAIVYDQPTLEFLVDRVGADRVLYGSDYPFLIGDMTGVLERVDALPAEDAALIRSGNAIRLFNL